MPESVPLESLDDIASFRPGYWKGKYYSPQFVRAIHENFQRFSSGDNPYYVPFLSINHQDPLRYGSIVSSRMDGDTLKLSARDIPKPVADWLRTKQLDERSIEFYEPKIINGTKVYEFFDQANKPVDGPVLRCLSLLGSEAPAVKGLGPLPEPKPQAERFSCQHVSRFSDQAKETTMDQALLDQLKSLNFDVSLIPADATDDLLKEIIRVLQAGTANVPPPPAPDATMSQPAPAPAPALPAAPAPAPAGPARVPTQVTTVEKFSDEFNRHMANWQQSNFGYLNTLRAQALVHSNRLAADDRKRKEQTITVFMDECKTQITPAMRPHILSLLMKCDNAVTRTFSDGKTQGTELDEQMKFIKDTYPVQRNAPTGQPRIGQRPVGGPNQSRQEVKDEVLKATPEGRAVLAKRAKTAAASNN